LSDDRFIESFIVSSGDGDRLGLHELLPAIGSRRPEATPEEVLAACRDASLAVLEAGHARFEMTPAHANRPGRDGYTAVSLEQARVILASDDAWQSPVESDPRYWFVATEAGKAEYISRETFSL
jgi:hypothetical protein